MIKIRLFILFVFTVSLVNTYAQELVTLKCSICAGSGSCHFCHGSGGVFTMMGWMTCPGCFGNGKCLGCKGAGFITRVYDPNVTYDSNSQNTYDDSSKEQSTRHKCRVCNGTGMKITERWMGSTTSESKWCDICKKKVILTHHHTHCDNCHGKGYAEY